MSGVSYSKLLTFSQDRKEVFSSRSIQVQVEEEGKVSSIDILMRLRSSHTIHDCSCVALAAVFGGCDTNVG